MSLFLTLSYFPSSLLSCPPRQTWGGELGERGDWTQNPPNTHTHTHPRGVPLENNLYGPGNAYPPPGIAIMERMGRLQYLWALSSASRREERAWVDLSKHVFLYFFVVVIVAFIVVRKRFLYSLCFLIKHIYLLNMTFDHLLHCCNFV